VKIKVSNITVATPELCETKSKIDLKVDYEVSQGKEFLEPDNGTAEVRETSPGQWEIEVKLKIDKLQELRNMLKKDPDYLPEITFQVNATATAKGKTCSVKAAFSESFEVQVGSGRGGASGGRGGTSAPSRKPSGTRPK